MSAFAVVLLLALTRSEIIERMRAPVVTQADGLVQVYADCPEDMRREFQSPVARFAADTVKVLYAGNGIRPMRFSRPGVVIHIGEVRTNDTSVIARVSTNAAGMAVSRLYLPSPGYADLWALRAEITRGFFRCVKKEELSRHEAVLAYRRADPAMRLADLRQDIEDWYTRGVGDDERMLKLVRKVIKPGTASRRDVRIFASRLFLYPPFADQRFANGASVLSFRDAVTCAGADPSVRLMASLKCNEPLIFGCGRGKELTDAARAYVDFLKALTDESTPQAELVARLDVADMRLDKAWRNSVPSGAAEIVK